MDLQQIINLCHVFDRNYDQRCTVREVMILAYLLENGVTGVMDLSHELRLGQPVVSRYLKKMEVLGMVVRDEGKAIATDKAKALFRN